MRPLATLAMVAALGVSCLWEHEARADVELQFALSANGQWMRRLPPLGTAAVSTSARDHAAGNIMRRGSLGLIGFAGDMELTIDDRWRIPLIGGALYFAAGSYDTTITSYDGSIVRLNPWTTFRGDFLLPGVGRRWKHRRIMWGVAVRTGVSITAMDGSIVAGAEQEPLKLSASTFLLQAEIEGCRRLDPTTRVCLQIAPRIYEHQIMNGLIFGLRMEWGQ